VRRPLTVPTERRVRRSVVLPAPTDYVAELHARQRRLVVESLVLCPRPHQRTGGPET
jgi:hypothetical protein